MKNVFLIVAFLLLSIFGTRAKAETGVSADFFYSYDSNTFRNYLALEDKIGQATLYFNHDFGTPNTPIHFYYQGNFYSFRNYVDRNFLFNQLGLAFSRRFPQNGTIFFSGVRFLNRLNAVKSFL